MTPQSYNVLNNPSYGILRWAIISRLLHSHAPHLVGMNGDVNSDLSILLFKNREQLEYFRSIILRPQKDIIFTGETLSLTRILLQYMNTFFNSDKLKSFIVPKMTDIIPFLDKNGKSDVYTGVNMHGLYCFL